jgi:hypothetical protein
VGLAEFPALFLIFEYYQFFLKKFMALNLYLTNNDRKVKKERKKRISSNNCDLTESIMGTSFASISSIFGATSGLAGGGGGGGTDKFLI